MKTKLLKRLRKKACRKYYITFDQKFYHIEYSYAFYETISIATFNKKDKDLALKECDRLRRAYILSHARDIYRIFSKETKLY